MTANQELLDSLRPRQHHNIVDLVEEAGVDVRPWSVDRFGLPVDPATNTYRNSQWTFGGDTDPCVACIWWEELCLDNGLIVRESNSRADALNWEGRKLDAKHDPEVGRRLTPKIAKARAFDRLMSEAYRLRLPIRAVLLDGNRASSEQASFESSSASLRELDPASWFVHSYDAYTGQFRLVRDVPSMGLPTRDPFDGTEDPGDNPAFVALLDAQGLSETEREALIKMRVGQGWFRSALITRWSGCALSHVRDTSYLIASHIKPWSRCVTRAERLSPDNGILLNPNIDRLFDRGMISFDDRFEILLSPKLTATDGMHLGALPGARLRKRTFAGMLPFLKWHRDNLFEA